MRAAETWVRAQQTLVAGFVPRWRPGLARAAWPATAAIWVGTRARLYLSRPLASIGTYGRGLGSWIFAKAPGSFSML